MPLNSVTLSALGRMFWNSLCDAKITELLDVEQDSSGGIAISLKPWDKMPPAARQAVEHCVNLIWADFEASAKENFRAMIGSTVAWAKALRGHLQDVVSHSDVGLAANHPDRLKEMLAHCRKTAAAGINLPGVIEVLR